MTINLIVIRTKEPKELSSFYKELGIQFEYHQHGKGSWHYSAEVEKTVFEIYPLMKNQELADKSLRLGFVIDNLDKLILKLESKGINIVSKPKESEWGYFAVIRDLDGREIELKER